MEIKRGQIAVNKKELIGLLDIVRSVENNIDEIMRESESFERGKKIAKQMNRLTFVRHAFEHFQLGKPLKSLK